MQMDTASVRAKPKICYLKTGNIFFKSIATNYLYTTKFQKMDKKITATAAVLGMVAIILGAFGAHALKIVLTVEELNTFETGVKYQMYHALFLLFIGFTASLSEKSRKGISILITIGVVLFSGSIYVLSTKNISGLDIKAFGIVTPIGGLLLISGWFWLFLSLIRKKS